MDILYPLVEQSRYRHFEFRMSLRSIEKHLGKVGTVYVIGHLPAWADNIVHIAAEDDTRRPPDFNIMNKIRLFCEQYQGEEFMLFNDDHFLMSDFQADQFPYFYSGTLDDKVRRRGPDPYGKRMSNTLEYLKGKGYPTKHFDIHYPIIYNKTEFIRTVVEAVDWKVSQGFVIKGLYCNSLGIEGTATEDFKLNSHPPKECRVFSTYPHIKHSIQRFLAEKFPEQCKYEQTGI
jgi:hypothetical protein